uniref:Uncharacterized protein n=1 Tax=Podoviridae sp. ctG4L18 TaxID=2825234 RepID=A0A8S5UNR6_9CAUD|nr:MAG TPA: hypothetical protein [Podoviridae sp. ctG4L18]
MVRKLHPIAPVYIVTSYNIIIIYTNRARLIINSNLSFGYKSSCTISIIYNGLPFAN